MSKPAMSLPRLSIVATGGTIAGAGVRPQATMAYAAGALDVDELCARVPGLDEVAGIQAEQFAAIDSKNATPAFWQSLAARVQALLDAGGCDGVVVTHGTDTLEETAYYLHLVLKTDKPVVLVGAMRPATALSPDGPLNLLDAVTVAAHPQAAGRGVLVVLNHQVLARATRPRPTPTGPMPLHRPTRAPWGGSRTAGSRGWDGLDMGIPAPRRSRPPRHWRRSRCWLVMPAVRRR